MKTKTLILAALLLCGVTAMTFAEEKAKIVAGPKGGKMLENEKPRAEFFVDKDRKVVIAFYADDMKPVAATEQTAVVWADAPTGRAKLVLEKKDGVLVSTEPLPEGDGYNVMVQFKSTPDAKSQNFKIMFHDEVCEKCKLAEYACTCDDHGHDHDHKDDKKVDDHKH